MGVIENMKEVADLVKKVGDKQIWLLGFRLDQDSRFPRNLEAGTRPGLSACLRPHPLVA
jgi:hypothetical protein